jgi:hypothetical protein
MRHLTAKIFAAAIAVGVAADAVAAPPDVAAAPFARSLLLVDDPGTIYQEREAPRADAGVNAGGAHFSLTVNYMTDYVYRGIDHSEVGAINPADRGHASEDAPNLQFDGKLSFDLGRLPHPFVGVFVNVFNDDPVSRFQEVRPFAGLEWTIKPLVVTAGWQAYIYPERDEFNTSEVFAKIELDDSLLFRTDKPVLSPYVYAAYDLDLYNGYYIEVGVKHDFRIGDTGVTLTAVADVAYVMGDAYFTASHGEDSGFQHYDLGVIGSYSLNTLLNVSRRYGDWKLKGYLYYTDGINHYLRADTQLWGGVGITFDY